MADLLIRAPRPEDMPSVAALEETCFTDPWSANALASHMAGAGGLLLVATDGQAVLGYISARLLPPESEIYRVAVDPAHRRRGIGEALLSAALDAARAQGVTHTFLDVRASNAPAIALYEKCGFTRLSRRRGYYRDPREDALILCKEESNYEISGI